MLGIQDLGIQNLGIQDIALFVVAGLLLNMTPGPDTAYIVGRSVQLGWRGGAAAALGIGAGCLVHIIAAAVGLSALLAASSTAFVVVKYAGAAYLCYAGLRMLFVRGKADVFGRPQVATMRAVFWQGALTNALNPKVALFFLAFLPQFVDAASPNKPVAFLLLGLLFDVNGTIWNLGVAAFAAPCRPRIPLICDVGVDQSGARRNVRLSRHPPGAVRNAVKFKPAARSLTRQDKVRAAISRQETSAGMHRRRAVPAPVARLTCRQTRRPSQLSPAAALPA